MTGGAEVLPLGVLVLVAGMLLAANAWAVVDARGATSSAAREAVRAYVESPDAESALARANAAAHEALAAHGRDPQRLTLELRHPDGTGWQRCASVEATVAYRVALVELPFRGGFGDSSVVRATHAGVVDPWRSGVGGEGCP